ncbi:MAG: hypothetical protein EPN92_01220 [Chitinophagaceae bacterium]|nr:MAG: hypothetical protein EPN92_01220 [Chitinophagaceae bacterium]
MFQLKKISAESIPEALEKAERYRLLNEPRLAESICLDILEADPKNSKAIVIMLLAITDEFSSPSPADVNEAKQLLSRLPGEYDRYYYGGIICERKGKSLLGKNIPDATFIVYEWLSDAMELYEKAEAIRPAGNDDTLLRWNTCARLIMRHHLKPRDEKYMEHQLE